MGKKGTLASFVKLVNTKYSLCFAVLFGSRARGDALGDSDYDILFVSDDFPKDRFERMAAVLELWNHEGALEPICLTSSEFKAALKQYNALVWESLKDGKTLFGAVKFRKYQKQFQEALKSGSIKMSGPANKIMKFNVPPERIFPSGN